LRRRRSQGPDGALRASDRGARRFGGAHNGEYGTEVRATILTLAYIGVRPGELCALRRRDLDERNRELTVRCSVDGTGVEKPPTNGKPRIVTVRWPALQAILRIPVSLVTMTSICSTRLADAV
jgi:integrase